MTDPNDTPSVAAPRAARPDYGIDAPHVIRNLLIVGAIGIAVWVTASLGWWSGVITVPKVAGIEIKFPLIRPAFWTAIGTIGMAIWMTWDSKVGKIRDREKLLDRIAWTGREKALDVGCGRGLMLVGAARRLTTGDATGIDIWQAEDLSGNRPESTLENARREGVADRVSVQTADMREIPFADGTFDVVVSCAAIHNIYTAAGRAAAISEISRVLKSGGHAIIDDIRHGREYARVFQRHGCSVRQVGSAAAALFLGLMTFGSLRPATLVVRKPE